jgi:GTP cyclohydrolase I
MDMVSRVFNDGSVHVQRGAVMPDVVEEHGAMNASRLDQVGMRGIAVAVRLPGGQTVPARCFAAVSLDDPVAKGIHMSRLYLALQERTATGVLDAACLGDLLTGFLASHARLSRQARIRFEYDLLLQRQSLASGHRAWRSYPVGFGGTLVADGRPRFDLSARITYSSTCPCSSALSRQLIQERFAAEFGESGNVPASRIHEWLGREESICAIPHSQRSLADVTVVVDESAEVPAHTDLIDAVEGVLVTVVQGAVKREDEREFARLGAQHPMFCEDACRLIRSQLDADARFSDYRIEIIHLESLHEHDAVSIAIKGVPGGLSA